MEQAFSQIKAQFHPAIVFGRPVKSIENYTFIFYGADRDFKVEYPRKLFTSKAERKMYQAYLNRTEAERDFRENLKTPSTKSLSATGMSIQKVSGYIFQVEKFGLINCDRFLNTPADQKKTLLVTNPEPKTVYRLLMRYRGAKSMIAYNDGFQNIPNDEQYTSLPSAKPTKKNWNMRY
jgi:hypothetical protein